ncbi:MAG: acyl-CoA dehydrogenase family protein [Syntrophobacteraceae bacterium]|jgi:glutaryl-CoA dehydrogenase|nr:acyl-CoA dehydrogenase family protein [Syntrophobacteraceae bacterium]
MSSREVDYFQCEELLSVEERAVRDRVRRWVESRYLPRAADCFEQGVFPVDLVPEMADLGLLGMKLHGYGGGGLNSVAYGLANQEVERGDSGLRSFISVMNALVIYPIEVFGSAEQRERWLPALVKGEAIGCFGMTEPLAGSDPQSMRTTAVRDGGDYVLNGRKMWITNGELAHVAVVWAQTGEGIRGFLVEKGAPGFSAHPIRRKFSLRASVTSALVLDGVRVPEASLLPGTTGLKSALMCLNEARYGIAWGAVGAAMACYEAALDHATTRIQFGAPIGATQLIQSKLVKMLTEITKAQLLCIRLGRLKDEGKARPPHVSMAKMNNSSEALKIARTARDILGASGITLGHCVIRHMLNLETVNTYEGTQDIHTLAIGRDITGLSAFSCQ